jgi:hypothetical protein
MPSLTRFWSISVMSDPHNIPAWRAMRKNLSIAYAVRQRASSPSRERSHSLRVYLQLSR